MAQWTHTICDVCWEKRKPNRTPFRLKEVDWQVCCFCGAHHKSGIFIRHDPKTLKHCQCTEGGG